MSHYHGPQCGCPKRIVYPVKHNCVHHCTESEVEHIHPSHTTVMNHHLVKNKHVFPHSTSVENTCSSVDVFGGRFHTSRPPMGGMMGPGTYTAGAMDPGMMKHGMKDWHKPNKWC